MARRLYALSAIFLWATFASLAVRLQHVPPFLLVGLGLLLGGFCSLHRVREWRVAPKILLVGIYGLFGFHLFIFLGLRLAPAVEANLINYLWPLLIVVLSPLFLQGYRLSRWHVVSVLLGFAGAALVITGGHLDFEITALPGYACAAAAAFIWATYSLLTKRMGSFPTAAIGLFCVIAGAGALACHEIFEPAYSIGTDEWPFLLALGLGPMGAAFFLWDAALKRGDARVIGSLAFLTPLLSTALLVFFGHGHLGATSALALGLILGGAVLGSRASVDTGIRRGKCRQ